MPLKKKLKEPRVHNPHDKFFKEIFSRREQAAALLQDRLPPELVPLLDWERLELVPAEFLTRAFREQRGDLVFSVPFLEETLLIYLMVEHQRVEEAGMALRLMLYSGEHYRHLVRQGKTEYGKLPPVIALVVHQGTEPWTEPLTISELCAPLPGAIRKQLRPLQPSFRYLLLDLATEQGQAISRHPFVRSMLELMQAVAEGRGLEWAQVKTDAMEKALPKGEENAMLEIIVMYLANADPEVTEEKLAEAWRNKPGLKEKAMTIYERLTTKGRLEGELKGILKVIAAILRRRFQHDYRRRLASLTAKAVRRLERDYMDFKSPEAVEQWLACHLPADVKKNAPKSRRKQSADVKLAVSDS